MDSAVTDFPEPDSPTSAKVSPRCRSNDTRSTAVNGSFLPVVKVTDRSRTRRRGASSMVLPENLAGFEGIAHRFAKEDEQGQRDCGDEKGGDAEPRRLQVRFALVEQLAQ